MLVNVRIPTSNTLLSVKIIEFKYNELVAFPKVSYLVRMSVNPLSKCFLQCPKSPFLFVFLLPDHTKHKLLSVIIRAGTILSFLNKFCIT